MNFEEFAKEARKYGIVCIHVQEGATCWTVLSDSVSLIVWPMSWAYRINQGGRMAGTPREALVAFAAAISGPAATCSCGAENPVSNKFCGMCGSKRFVPVTLNDLLAFLEGHAVNQRDPVWGYKCKQWRSQLADLLAKKEA